MAKKIFTDEFFYILSSSLLLVGLILLSSLGLPGWLGVIRAVLGLAFVLFIPGYCLQAVAFPAHSDIDGKERVALSFGLSLAVIPTLALILDFFLDINLWSVTLAFLVFILLFSTLAMVRRSRLPEDQRYYPLKEAHPVAGWQSLERSQRRAYLLMGVVVLLAGFTAVSILTSTKPAERMTEFYILATGGKAEDYPRQGTAGQPLSVIVGIRNLEGAGASYRVEVRDAKGVIGQHGRIQLEDGGKSEQPLVFRPQQTGQDVEVTFLLFRDTISQPYRTLRLFLKVNPAQ